MLFPVSSVLLPCITDNKMHTLFQCHHFCHGKCKCIAKDKNHTLLQESSLWGVSKKTDTWLPPSRTGTQKKNLQTLFLCTHVQCARNVNVDIHLVTADYIRLAEIWSCLTFKRILKGISWTCLFVTMSEEGTPFQIIRDMFQGYFNMQLWLQG